MGLVKSIQVGGDGNAYLMLKDPTGSIGATLEREVLREECPLAAGAVLVLENVTAFSPTEGCYVLCITQDNVLQVIRT